MRISVIRNFIETNRTLSSRFEGLFNFNRDDGLLLREVFENLESYSSIADVGGGKKPAKEIIGKVTDNLVYDGYDISLDELNEARNSYTDIYQLDLTSNITDIKRYDLIICLNTLEHVSDVKPAIKNLAEMLNDGGHLYIKLPSKYAIFAQLNKLLPQTLKKNLLHAVFPEKVGDGFEAYYDCACPDQIIEISHKNGLSLIEKNLVKWSSYFTFFLPLYILWRMVTIFQNVFNKNYCESFEILLKKDVK